MSNSDHHMTYDINAVRKAMIWAIPLFLCCILLGVFLSNIAWTSFIEIQSLAPLVRIRFGSIIGPAMILMMASAVVGGCARAIPLKRTFALAERAAVITTVFGMLTMVFALVAGRPIQSHFMPQYGYSRCSVLQGNPTVWFQDWVRNPEWCVSGKSREWVTKQAGLSEKK